MATSVTPAVATRDIDVLGYRVRIGWGLVRRVATEARDVAAAHTYAIITDENVARHWLGAVQEAFRALSPAPRVISQAIPPGEGQKTRETWSRLTDWMLASGCGRDSAVVALGGGVIGDLAGFVAATYMRGVPVVQVPTTLLAMVDASIGGKTGVDTGAGKNLVGAFHQPAAVLVDPSVLATLPVEQLRAGMAELIKHGAISDPRLFDDSARFAAAAVSGAMDWSGEGAAHLIARNIAVKVDVVRRDERESGLRQVLNAGHTVAHAIELVSGFRYLHGEAVSIGLVAETRLAERAGIATNGTARRLADVLGAAGLPTRLPTDLPVTELVAAMQSDKKVRAGRLAFTLLADIGRPAGSDERGWTTSLNAPDVASWLGETAAT